MRSKPAWLFFAAVLSLWPVIPPHAFAQQATTDLERSISDKQKEIDAMKKKAKDIEARIQAAERAQNTYANTLSLLQNKTKRTELEIQETETALLQAQLESERIAQETQKTQESIAKQKRTIGSILQKLHETEETEPMLFLFQKKTLGEFFEQWQYLRSLQDALKQSLDRLEAEKQNLGAQEKRAQAKKSDIQALRASLESAKDVLDRDQNATASLLSASGASEARYRELLQGIKEEQQYTASELFRLQDKLRARLAQRGVASGTFAWPVNNPRITTLFHDPTYPFRRLFEHSGLDMAIPAGTPVRATEAGYVVTARSGSTGYGNYVMIVHADGMASLYAHLSKILVSPDQFVEQGSMIGRSGGVPGMPGAGLSTGAHLHFEIRENGIPVDPYRYLSDVGN